MIELSSNNAAYKFTLKWPVGNNYSIQTDDGAVELKSWQLVTATTFTENDGDRRMKLYVGKDMKKELLISLDDAPF